MIVSGLVCFVRHSILVGPFRVFVLIDSKHVEYSYASDYCGVRIESSCTVRPAGIAMASTDWVCTTWAEPPEVSFGNHRLQSPEKPVNHHHQKVKEDNWERNGWGNHAPFNPRDPSIIPITSRKTKHSEGETTGIHVDILNPFRETPRLRKLSFAVTGWLTVCFRRGSRDIFLGGNWGLSGCLPCTRCLPF